MTVHWLPQHGKCPDTGKRCYPCRHAAKVDARAIHGSVYRCKHCDHYHLTHYPAKVQRAISLVMGIRA